MENTNTNENEQKVEETNKVSETESTEANSNDGKYELDVLGEAQKLTNELRIQNEVKQKLLDREERIIARRETLRALGGGSPAGQVAEKPKEETPKEYAERILNGKRKLN